MGDVMTPEQRSRTMGHIKSKDTSIEVILRKALWHKGYRYRRNYKKLPGAPDIAITKYKIAIFCDSEFFHGYNWEVKKQKLGHNREFWVKKIERNMSRDRDTDLKLVAMDWVPMHFWGDEIKKHPSQCVEAVEDLIFELKISRSCAMIRDNRDDFILPDGDKA